MGSLGVVLLVGMNMTLPDVHMTQTPTPFAGMHITPDPHPICRYAHDTQNPTLLVGTTDRYSQITTIGWHPQVPSLW